MFPDHSLVDGDTVKRKHDSLLILSRESIDLFLATIFSSHINKSMSKLDNTFKDTWITRSEALKDSTYKEYLESEEWKSIKLKARKRKAYRKCLKCGSTENIHLHHRSYNHLFTKNAMRGLVPLCGLDHKKVHELAKENNVSVRVATNEFLKDYFSNLKHIIKSNIGI